MNQSETTSASGEGEKVRASFRNMAGREDIDDALAAELEAAGITVHRHRLLKNGQSEVNTEVMGDLHGWGFRRAWRYWVAEGPGIEIAAAERLHAAHGNDVRVSGHCGCPSPREQFNGLAVGFYHVDSPDGLKALADTIRELVERPAALAAPTAKGGTEVPAGWKLVPERPTPAMSKAGDMYTNCGGPCGNRAGADAYRAMLAASPPPPAGAAGGGSGDLGALSAGASALARARTAYYGVNHRDPGTEELAAALRAAGIADPCAPTPDLGAQGEPVAQGTLADEPYDPLKAAVWRALTPFMVEMMQTGGVTFMGLRNAVVAAVRPLYEAPAAPRPGSGVSVDREAVREILGRLWCFAEGQAPDDTISGAGHTVLCATLGGLDPRITRQIDEHADLILALCAQAPRDGGETQGGPTTHTHPIACYDLSRRKLAGIEEAWDQHTALDEGDISFLIRMARQRLYEDATTSSGTSTGEGQ